MYNTIEVIVLKITQAQIRFLKKGGFSSVSYDNIKHVKVLPWLSIVQSIEGSYDITLGNNEKKQTGEGGFFIAPSNVQQTIVHHDDPKSEKMSCRWIFLDVKVNNSYKLDTLYEFPAVITDDKKSEFNIIFDRLFATDDIWGNYSDCYQPLGLLLQLSKPIKKEPHSGIQRAVTYMSEHYNETITIGKLAQLSNMSESNFYTVFKKHFGDSPIAYLNNYRLSLAADKLTETEDSISEISYSVGIGDSLYFSKLFKKTHGMSPKAYRDVYKTGNTQV